MKYVDIDSLPGEIMDKYPWPEWEKIPPGKALEVTDTLKELGVSARHFQSSCNSRAAFKGLKIRVRAPRAFVYRPQED